MGVEQRAPRGSCTGGDLLEFRDAIVAIDHLRHRVGGQDHVEVPGTKPCHRERARRPLVIADVDDAAIERKRREGCVQPKRHTDGLIQEESMNILITGIGGPTPRSIAKTIRKNYPGHRIIGVDANSKALGFYMKGLCDEFEVIPKATEDNYWKVIEDIKEKYLIEIAFIQPEKEVISWGKYFKENGDFPIPTFIPPLEYSHALVDKANMSDLLLNSDFIPKTIRISPKDPQLDKIESEIGYPCWIRATTGSGGFGSMKINNVNNLEAWLFIHSHVKEFTVSEFLPGKHLANQMMYINGELIKSAGLECVEYVMAEVAPSKVTGNTSFGRMINNDRLLSFCEECMDYISNKLDVQPHGVFSFDLKEDIDSNLKLTEINIRHMAYTGILSELGFDLTGDSINYLTGNMDRIIKGRHSFKKEYVFLRDVDIEPLIIEEKDLLT